MKKIKPNINSCFISLFILSPLTWILSISKCLLWYPHQFFLPKPTYWPKKQTYVWYQIKKVPWGSDGLYPGLSSVSLSWLSLKIPVDYHFCAPTDSICSNITSVLVFFLPSDSDLLFCSLPTTKINQTHRHAIFQVFPRYIFEQLAEFLVACDTDTMEYTKASLPYCTTVFLQENLHVLLPCLWR